MLWCVSDSTPITQHHVKLSHKLKKMCYLVSTKIFGFFGIVSYNFSSSLSLDTRTNHFSTLNKTEILEQI